MQKERDVYKRGVTGEERDSGRQLRRQTHSRGKAIKKTKRDQTQESRSERKRMGEKVERERVRMSRVCVCVCVCVCVLRWLIANIQSHPLKQSSRIEECKTVVANDKKQLKINKMKIHLRNNGN